MIKNIISIISGLLFLGTSLIAQSPLKNTEETTKTILSQIIAAYHQQENLSVIIDYYYYDKLTDTDPSYDLKVEMILGQQQYYVKSDLFELLHSPKGSLYIDKEEKTIVVQPPSDKSNAALEIGGLGLEALLQQPEFVFQSFQEKELSGLRITAPNHSASIIELKYQKDSHLLEKVLLKVDVPEGKHFGAVDNQTKLEAFYSNYKKNTGAFPFNIKQFIQKKGKQWLPTKDYKNYKIMSQ